MNIVFGKIELEDWKPITTGELCRYSVNYSQNLDAAIVIWASHINSINLSWAPSFSHKLYFLNGIYRALYGEFTIGTIDQAKEQIDKFLIKINSLAVFT
jgi:hypothetical protein